MYKTFIVQEWYSSVLTVKYYPEHSCEFLNSQTKAAASRDSKDKKGSDTRKPVTCVSLFIPLVILSTFLKLQISAESLAAPYLLALSVGDRKFDRALLAALYCASSALHTVLHRRVLTPENLKMTLTERMKKETRKARTVTRRKRRRKRTRMLCSACGATRTARPGDEAAPACP